MNRIFYIDNILIKLQGEGTPFWDTFFSTYSNVYLWCPMLFVLLCILIKNNSVKDFLFIVSILLVTAVVTEFAFIPLWEYLSGTTSVNNSAISSHTSGILGTILFISYIIKKNTLTTSLLLWVLINIYSGIYLHEYTPGNITIPIVIGVVMGLISSLTYKFIRKKQRGGNRDWISTQYTKSGYLVSDVHFLLVMLYGTFSLVPVIAFIFGK